MQKKIIQPKNQNISWSVGELNIWVEDGLISRDLLHPDKFHELAQFVSENKEKLYEHYHDNTDEYPYSIEMPSTQKLDNTYEIRVVEKATGKTVQVLDRVENLNLYDGFSLKVKSKEVENWRKQSAELKQLWLSKEQILSLKNALSKISAAGKEISVENLAIIIEEILKLTKSPSYPVPTHLIGQKIHPVKKVSIQNSKITASGLRNLTATGHRITRTLSQLRHQYIGPKIEGMDLPSGKLCNKIIENYYGYPPEIFILDEDEYCKTYWGNDKYGGKDRKAMLKNLKNYSKEEHSFDYKRYYKQDGVELVDVIKFEAPMAEVYPYYKGLTQDEASGKTSIKKQSKKKIIIIYNPIFIDQIENYFLTFSNDINRRITEAAKAAGTKAHTYIQIAYDHFYHEIHRGKEDPKRFNSSILKENLIHKLGLEGMRRGRQEKALEKTFKFLKIIGIMLKIEKVKSTDGRSHKYDYKLNDKYPG